MLYSVATELERVYAIIADVLHKYVFTHPVELGDCVHVRQDLIAHLPIGYTCEVYHTISQVHVQIWDPKKIRIYARNLSVQGWVASVPLRR